MGWTCLFATPNSNYSYYISDIQFKLNFTHKISISIHGTTGIDEKLLVGLGPMTGIEQFIWKAIEGRTTAT